MIDTFVMGIFNTLPNKVWAIFVCIWFHIHQFGPYIKKKVLDNDVALHWLYFAHKCTVNKPFTNLLTLTQLKRYLVINVYFSIVNVVKLYILWVGF